MSGQSVRKWAIVLVAVALVVGGGLWGAYRHWEKGLSEVDESLKRQALPKPGNANASWVDQGLPGESAAVQPSPVASAGGKGKKRVQKEKRSQEEIEADAWVARILAPIQAELDSDDPKVIVAAARKIMNHPTAAVRSKAIEGFAWADGEGFADLTKMVRDQDPEVAQEALEAWALNAQSMDYSAEKIATIKEVGEYELKNGADAFQEVLDAMFDLPDSVALGLLSGYANQTTDADILEKIIDDVNFRAQPDEPITSVDGIAGAITEFNKRQAEEDAQEAGTQTATTLTTTSETN